MKITIARGKLIELFVKYENKVDDRCVNQTSRNSSGNAFEHWQLWLTNQQLSTFARLVRILENWIFNIDSNKEHKEVKVLCTLEPSGTTATPEHNRRIQFPVFSRGHLTSRGLQLDATDCNTEETENLQACSTDNNSTNSGNPFAVFERGGSWMVVAVYAFFFVSVVFINYSPAFLCLLLPTEVTEDGVHKIILEGASPALYISFFTTRLNPALAKPCSVCSYSSFTNSYQDLALALFKHYKKSRHDKFVAMSVNTDQVQVNITADYEDDVVKIPKKLFHMACEKLMPIREGVCILILKITTIASFLFIVFSIAMLRGGGASPVMKALMTFLTGLLPKILAIYIDGGRQKTIEAMVSEEKIPKIVQEYIKTTNGTSESNQGQDNSGADDDAEVISILNDNQENTSLLNL
ncbi:hypothetical protein ACROYT_G034866 [Oculina patagonica]